MAGTYNITCEQGATFQRVITWKDKDGNLTNLSGYTAAMQVRASRCAPNVISTLTSANAKIALGGALGTITLTLTATETAALPIGEFVYDLELTTGSTVYRLLAGTFTVSGEVTR